ncbi:MAG: hypothetical protein HY049_13735 [Acidobacteria bacterium]|nr:hypothetical protein [Acidobacteriota bacterium]
MRIHPGDMPDTSHSAGARARCVRRWLTVVLILVSPSGVCRAERFPAKVYTTSDGLARDAVTGVIQDSRGFLWIATMGGVSRFDGYRFATLGIEQGLPSDAVAALLETRRGDLWVGTRRGLCRFEPRPRPGARQFTTVRALGAASDPEINVLLEQPDGAVLVGTDRGLFELTEPPGPPSLRKVEIAFDPGEGEGEVVESLARDRRGSLWIGARSGLYRRLSGGRLEHFTERDGLPQNRVISILEDRRGRLWIGTAAGLVRLVADPSPGRSIVERRFTRLDGLPEKWVLALYESRDGSVWAGTTAGLGWMAPAAVPERFRMLGRAEGLGHESISSIAEDREGNLWVGTEAGGVTKLASYGLVSYQESDGIGRGTVSQIGESRDGILFVREEERIFELSGERFLDVTPKIPPSIDYLGWGWNQLLLQDRLGIWWYPTGRGLCRYPKGTLLEDLPRRLPERIYTTRDGLPGDVIFRVFEDSRSDIWVGVGGEPTHRLARLDRRTDRFESFRAADGLPDIPVYPSSFTEDRSGAVWVGLYHGGLLRHRRDRFDFFDARDGLPAGLIGDLHVDRSGRLWIAGSRGGVACVDDPAAERPSFRSYTTREGLASDLCAALAEDREGRIYVGHSRGVDRLDTATGRVRHFTSTDGLAGNDPTVAHGDGAGDLWFGSKLGLSRLTPRPDVPALAPEIRIDGLKIAGARSPLSAYGESEIGPTHLTSDERDVEIEYSSVTFLAGERRLYQTRLEGADEDWLPPTEKRVITYANLTPGTYRFLVRAIDSSGRLSARPASFDFTVTPPLWRRLWFRISLLAALAGLAYAAHRVRVAGLVGLERVRIEIAADLHDAIGSGLGSIGILAELAGRNGMEESVRRTLASRIAAMAAELGSSLGDIVWSLGPASAELEALAAHIAERASRMFPEEGRDLVLDFPSPWPRVSASLTVRRNVLLIALEAIHNAAKHSGARRATLRLAPEGRLWRLDVEDDGRGMTDVTPDRRGRRGMGLANMRARAGEMGARIEWTALAPSGTRVSLWFRPEAEGRPPASHDHATGAGRELGAP